MDFINDPKICCFQWIIWKLYEVVLYHSYHISSTSALEEVVTEEVNWRRCSTLYRPTMAASKH